MHRLAVVLPLPPDGGSIGGVIFSPLWVATIVVLGFAKAAVLVGLVMIAAMWVLADRLFSRTPKETGLAPDGDLRNSPAPFRELPNATSLPGSSLWLGMPRRGSSTAVTALRLMRSFSLPVP